MDENPALMLETSTTKTVEETLAPNYAPASLIKRDLYRAPIYRIPNELLQIILLHAASETDDPLPYCVSSTFCRVATEVCHKWRNICLETGDFWTVVDFSEGPPFSRTLLHIQRAKNRPLTLRATAHNGIQPKGEVLPIFRDILHRIGRFDMDVYNSTANCISNQFNVYEEKLSLYGASCDLHFIDTPFLKRIHRLHILTLHRAGMNSLLSIGSDLTILHLHVVRCRTSLQIWTFLERCSGLDELLIDDWSLVSHGHPDTSEDPNGIILFRNLTRLTLRAVSVPIITKIYLAVVAPILRSIDIDQPTEPSLNFLLTFLQRSLPEHTSTLYLDHIALYKWLSRHVEFLKTVPSDNCRTLNFTDGSLPDHVLIALTPGGDCSCSPKTCTHYLCPNLSELRLANLEYCSHTRLVTMVQMRALSANHASHMRIVDVRNCCPSQKLINPGAEVKRMGTKVRACGVEGVWDWKLPVAL
jgi:hypothetical protein